jgi:hypothetical protein
MHGAKITNKTMILARARESKGTRMRPHIGEPTEGEHFHLQVPVQ